MRHVRFIVTLFAMFAACWCCHNAVADLTKGQGIPDDFPADIKTMLNDPALSGSITGIMVVDTKDGSVIFQHDQDTRLIPASNRKLFTSAAALELLGDNYTIPTTVSADAKPDANGIINGNLYIKGNGDAILSVTDLSAFVSQLKAAGVKEITGDLVGDSSFFTDGPYPEGWDVDYLTDDYAPQVEALEINEGTINVAVSPSATVGQPPSVTLTPATDYIPVVNTCATVPVSGTTNVDIERPYNKNEIDISGTVKLGDTVDPVDVTVDNPPLYCVTLFNQYLAAEGIKMDGKLRLDKVPATAVQLCEHDSVPMTQWIKIMNKPSDNLQAESLVRILGAVKGVGGSFDGGSPVENGFFTACGITPDEMIFADGSGVTRLDQVSAHAVIKLLTAMAAKPDFQAYYDSLPIAGVDGTLKHRMIGTPAQGNVHAKTGTVRYCHALSGYLTDQAGHLLAFSIINNNFACDVSEVNRIQNDIAVKLVSYK